jgi:NitT/TauT family transport system substrate-binding protein
MCRAVRRLSALAPFLVAGGLALDTGAVARAEVPEIRIGVQFGLAYLPVAVADDQGMFAAHARKLGLGDLRVSVQRLSGSPAVDDALLAGRLDLGAYGMPALLVAWDKTKGRENLHGVAALAAHPFILDTNKPEIKAFTDFTDRDRIAVPAVDSPQAILLRMAAEKFYGAGQFARIDKLLVSMPHPDATAALLAGGGISGYVATPPFIAPLARSERIHAVVTSKEILGGDEATGAALAAVKTFVDANPKVTQAVVAALDDAMTFIVKDPAAAADIYIASESATIPKDQIVDMLKDGTMMYSVAPSGVLKFAAFMAKTGELKTAPKSWHEVFFPVLGFRRGS